MRLKHTALNTGRGRFCLWRLLAMEHTSPLERTSGRLAQILPNLAVSSCVNTIVAVPQLGTSAMCVRVPVRFVPVVNQQHPVSWDTGQQYSAVTSRGNAGCEQQSPVEPDARVARTLHARCHAGVSNFWMSAQNRINRFYERFGGSTGGGTLARERRPPGDQQRHKGVTTPT